MRDKRDLPFSTASPSGDSTMMQGGYRPSPFGRPQPPSVGSPRGHVEVPVGALVRYLGTHRRITFEDWQSDTAMVLGKMGVHRDVICPQANPEVWPLRVSVLLIQWLQEPGVYADDRWKPRSWLEKDGDLICKHGWEAGRGPVWVMEHAGTGIGDIIWEVIE